MSKKRIAEHDDTTAHIVGTPEEVHAFVMREEIKHAAMVEASGGTLAPMTAARLAEYEKELQAGVNQAALIATAGNDADDDASDIESGEYDGIEF